MIFNNIEYNINSEIAEKFNNCFVDSIKDIRFSIEDVQYMNQISVINCRFKFHTISLLELRNMSLSIKKKNYYTRISNYIILDNWNLVGNILFEIINKSMEAGIFPDNWKESLVTSIEKIRNTSKCDEFRSINSLKTKKEKVVEIVVKQQLENYMEENKLLSKYHSSFRRKFSCETAVNYVVSYWKNAKNKRILEIFLDFMRAFETIDRAFLLRKLLKYGIENEGELMWFRSYLTNRKQTTRVNKTESIPIENKYGVPQGSILGALLFIMILLVCVTKI